MHGGQRVHRIAAESPIDIAGERDPRVAGRPRHSRGLLQARARRERRERGQAGDAADGVFDSVHATVLGRERQPGVAPVPPPPASDSDHLSYLSTQTFVLALFGSLVRPTPAQPRPGLAELEASISALPDTKLKSSLQAALISAQGDFEQFRTSVSRWFDDSMDRLSGAYKRNMQFLAIVVGLLARRDRQRRQPDCRPCAVVGQRAAGRDGADR